MTRSARRGPWLPEEDCALLQLVQTQGANNWVRISQQIQHRSPKQCRERYHQNLKPSLKHEPISMQEGERIEQMVAEMGKRWAEIARRLGNRSDNTVKNWWNGSMNRRRRNPTQATTGFKQVGTRLQPVHFSQSPNSSHTLHLQPQYDSRYSSDPHQWVHASVDASKSHHTSTMQLPSPVHTSGSVTNDSTPNYPFDHRTSQPSQQGLSQPDRPEFLRPALSRTSTTEQRPELPPLRSGSHGNRFDKRDSALEQPLISPALSEASQPASLRHPPSLISDNQSTLSISPRTVTSPKPSILAPIEIGSGVSHQWLPLEQPRHSMPTLSHSSQNSVLSYTSEQGARHESHRYHHEYHRLPFSDSDTLKRSHENLSHHPIAVTKHKDSRMNLSSVLG